MTKNSVVTAHELGACGGSWLANGDLVMVKLALTMEGKRRILNCECDRLLIELATVNPIMPRGNPCLGGICTLFGHFGNRGGTGVGTISH